MCRLKSLNLLYHRVNNLHPDPWTTSVSPHHFAEHLEIIRRWSPRPTLTFDDGYADNLQTVLPLLERFDVKAQLFVVTGALGSTREMWWDALDFLYLEGEKDFSFEDLGHTRRQQTYIDNFWLLRSLPAPSQDLRLDALFRQAGKLRDARPERRMLTQNELLELASSPLIEIGAHTVTHPVLSLLPVDAQEREIRNSKADLEAIAGRSVDGFSYPNGMPADYTEDTVKAVSRAGFRYAYVAFDGESSSCFEIPRVMIRDWNGEQFTRVLREATVSKPHLNFFAGESTYG